MVYIVLFIIIFICLFAFDSYYGWMERIGLLLCSILGGALLGLLLWICAGSIIGCCLPKVEITEQKELYALNDGSNLSGQFYLFGGYVDEEQVIKYISDGEYGKKIYTAKADCSYINEGIENPYLEIHKQKFKKDWYWWFAINLEKNVYVFYVPNGSVTNEIKVDLE